VNENEIGVLETKLLPAPAMLIASFSVVTGVMLKLEHNVNDGEQVKVAEFTNEMLAIDKIANEILKEKRKFVKFNFSNFK
jgi:hypothetical protein